MVEPRIVITPSGNLLNAGAINATTMAKTNCRQALIDGNFVAPLIKVLLTLWQINGETYNGKQKQLGFCSQVKRRKQSV
jgi:hypothetical protein